MGQTVMNTAYPLFYHNTFPLQISYLIFLSLFGYMLLKESSEQLIAVDILMILWVISMTVEEIRQVHSINNIKHLSHRNDHYFRCLLQMMSFNILHCACLK